MAEGKRRGRDPSSREPARNVGQRDQADRAPQHGFGAASGSRSGGAKSTRSRPCSGIRTRDACASRVERHEWQTRVEGAGGTLFRRRRGKKRNSRAKGQAGRAPSRLDIRPEIVEEKSRVGDWEGDTSCRGAVLSLADRASRFTLLALLGGRTARETGLASGPYKEFVHTTDNGKEFAAHRAVAGGSVVLLRAAAPFLGARPERTPERAGPPVQGDRLSQAGPLKRLETLLNNRPRKALGYRTPAEVFKQGLAERPASQA